MTKNSKKKVIEEKPKEMGLSEDLKTYTSVLTAQVEDQVTKKLVPIINNGFEIIEKKLKEEFRNEFKELRSALGKSPNSGGTLPSDSNDLVSLAKKAMDDPQVRQQLGSLGINLGGGQSDVSRPMGLMEMIQAIKLLDSGSGSGLGGNVMVGLIERNMISQMHMQNQLFNQIVKDSLRKHGATPADLIEYDKTQGVLTDPLTHIGSREEAKKLAESQNK